LYKNFVGFGPTMTVKDFKENVFECCNDQINFLVDIIYNFMEELKIIFHLHEGVTYAVVYFYYHIHLIESLYSDLLNESDLYIYFMDKPNKKVYKKLIFRFTTSEEQPYRIVRRKFLGFE
jgi:hypothetical protein